MTTWGQCQPKTPADWGQCETGDTFYDPDLPCELPAGGTEAVEVTSLRYPLYVPDSMSPSLVVDEILVIPAFLEELQTVYILDEILKVQVLFEQSYEGPPDDMQPDFILDEIAKVEILTPRFYESPPEDLQPDLLLTEVLVVQVLFPIYYDRGTHDLSPSLTLDSIDVVQP